MASDEGLVQQPQVLCQMGRIYLGIIYGTQGVRQGGCWSPTAYKMFINLLLALLEINDLECKIGSIHVGTPTCADDIVLLCDDPCELLVMLHLQGNFAARERYNLNDKSKIMIFNQPKKRQDELVNFEFYDKPLEVVFNYKHLGITRSSGSKNSPEGITDVRIQLARRTTYSLMGAGLHGYSRVNPKVLINLWNTYVRPRMVYGLEAVVLIKKDQL
ncbi:uncharacterized protein [Argopecten irradians]|uniref:uncharacterized protein n=1 Tax=Argopecten irradians TaxID=31199 RepID=UPI003722CBEA